ncbi:tyrosine--tRNA ligase [Candidatus Babeliales bacterium]|nr:tyrosine--tRNA ligase [Candidatus Babeliales bacterium]MCF7899648.1 tyrosine--tRNA ligase [Candidatus Babeliales bacterium]
MNKNNLNETVKILKSGTAQVLPEDDFVKKLSSGKKLKIKLGMDPTAPDLHLGHAVVLSKLKQFQFLGHEIIFLIGDFTARIGDPTGKSKTRPPLSEEQVKTNSKTYLNQIGKILDISKTKVCYNSEWLSKISFEDVIKLTGKVTLARLIEREDFAKRMKENESIGFHELFYPILQGYDSVFLKADIELGGTDQTFNLLFGRFLQEQFDQEPQVIMTMPILEGLDGVQKMSKSLGNYVGLWESADQAYGKLMSISDELMWRYFLLLLDKTEDKIEQMQLDVKTEKLHPMKLKKQMAYDIIKKFWSEQEAEFAQEKFESLFQKRDYSVATEIEMPKDNSNPIWIVDLLKLLGVATTSSQVKRLLQDGAVYIDGLEIKDLKAEIYWVSGQIIKVGKHKIFKIK